MSFELAHAMIYKDGKTRLTRHNFKTEVKEWLRTHPTNSEEEEWNKNEEKTWGCAIQIIQSKQWTTKLGEFCVALVLTKMSTPSSLSTTSLTNKSSFSLPNTHTSPKKITNIVYQPKHTLTFNGMKQTYTPDFECDQFFVEVKTRTWCVPGTIGQKNFGSFYHYLPLVSEMKKPLIIVFLAYAEQEMKTNLRITGHQHQSQKDCITFLESKGIHFVPYSELKTFINTYQHNFPNNMSPLNVNNEHTNEDIVNSVDIEEDDGWYDYVVDSRPSERYDIENQAMEDDDEWNYYNNPPNTDDEEESIQPMCTLF